MWLRAVSWLFVIAAAAAAAASEEFLLPGDLRPVHYDLAIAYHIDELTRFPFYGLVKIQFKVRKPTIKIILHAKSYEILNEKISLIGPTGDFPKRKVREVQVESDSSDLLTLTLNAELTQDFNYTLTVPFFGRVGTALEGAYVSSYFDSNNNNTEYVISTQFEPSSARLAFPCFDEPRWRSSFTVTLGHGAGYSAISNMPSRHNLTIVNPLEDFFPWEMLSRTFKVDKHQYTWDQFEPSVPMSSYLVAYVISKFSSEESARNSSHVLVRGWTRKNALAQTSYALKVGPEIITLLEKLLNIRYPLPKIDMVAIPDHPARGMEHWGLITFEESFFLYDKLESSSTEKESILKVIGDELSHQWFGNLVTMKWWNERWLKEGFSSYMSQVIVTNIEPAWRHEETELAASMHHVLDLDSLLHSHPLSVNIVHPKMLPQIFDVISYHKGTLLVRMLTSILGDKLFWEAMNKYLTLAVKIKTPESWWIPLSVLKQSADIKNESIFWLSPEEGKKDEKRFLLVNTFLKDEWVVFNKEMIAPLRVNYDERNWELLIKTLNNDTYTTIPTLSRAQLLDDALSFAWSNDIDSYYALNLAKYLRRETEFVALQTGISALALFDKVLMFNSDYGIFQTFVRDLITPAYQRSGGLFVKDILRCDDVLAVKMQVLISQTACYYKVQGCEENSIELFNKWMKKNLPDTDNPIPVSLRGAVYCVAAARGSVVQWEFLRQRLRAHPLAPAPAPAPAAASAATPTAAPTPAPAPAAAPAAAARRTLLAGMACTTDIVLLKRLHDWTIAPNSEIRKHESITILENSINTAIGFYFTKDFIMKRLQDIDEAVGGLRHKLHSIIGEMIGKVTTEADLNQILQWKENNTKYLSGVMDVDKGIEQARKNIDWLKVNKKSFLADLNIINEETKKIFIFEKRSLASSTKRINKNLILSLVLYFLNIV